MTSVPAQRSDTRPVVEGAAFSIILALSFSHFLNDTMQSLVPALYPMLKDSYSLSFAQIGLITLVMQVTSSLLQPMVGSFADRRPQPYSLAIGMGATFIGLLLLASASSFILLLPAAALFCCCQRRLWSAPARRCFTRKRLGSPGWPRAGGTGWRSHCSRSAAISARRSDRSSRP